MSEHHGHKGGVNGWRSGLINMQASASMVVLL